MTLEIRENHDTRLRVDPRHGSGTSQYIKKIASLIFVDNDDDYRCAACAKLEILGFEVEPFADSRSMFEYLGSNPKKDLIVLDWRLSRESGTEVLQELCRGKIALPVVILTRLASPEDERIALDLGALDFVDKSRGAEVLAKRVELIVSGRRRPPGLPAEHRILCGQLELRPKIGRALWKGTDVDLTVTEFNIVYRLVSEAREYVTYRAIYDCVQRTGFRAGNGDDGYRTNVRSSLKRIRNKFRGIDVDFAEIENFASFGYRWRDKTTLVE